MNDLGESKHKFSLWSRQTNKSNCVIQQLRVLLAERHIFSSDCFVETVVCCYHMLCYRSCVLCLLCVVARSGGCCFVLCCHSQRRLSSYALWHNSQRSFAIGVVRFVNSANGFVLLSYALWGVLAALCWYCSVSLLTMVCHDLTKLQRAST